jgi:hypothetical protein
MAIIHFTAEELRDPFDSDPPLIRTECAPLCDGEDCGERVLLSENDQQRLGWRNPDPLGPHYHLVVSGENPPAKSRRHAVISK